MRRLSLATVTVFALITWPARAAELTFDERVRAQTAIERVYYSHQVGATVPFDEAVSRTVIEDRVRTYLRQSVALEDYWATPVTSEMLRREVERIVRGTRMPGRLGELFGALGNDALLVEECLARPVLVDRLARGFFARDERIHAASRSEADDAYKVTWDAWWAEAAGGFDESRARVTARGDAELPAVADSCVPDDTWDNGALAALPSPRRNHTIVWTGSEVVVWGGYDGARTSTGSRYDPATDSWTPTATLNAPSARWSHTAVWTGDSMVVWGGYDGTHAATGGRYDPASDSWTATSTQGAPSGRVSHTAEWTGSKMIVWGGSSSNVPTNTGGVYDPATDTWTPSSTQSAPSARSSHTAVWTESKMVVWGGLGAGDTPLATGGQYDPTTDTWTPTSMFHPPAARGRHSSVWTGSRMIVWGGALDAIGFDPINTGGRYDPATDTWSPTSVLDADVPAPRHDHVAVWTGSRMIVWGGATGHFDTDSVDTGGQYDPMANSWTPTSTLNAPSERAGHTAVWTGSLALVWGGSDSTSSFNTGGRYDPTADAWTPTSTLSAPAARASHTAVWTGNLMVVWAGADGSSSFDTGGRYDPVLDGWTPTSTLGAPSARRDPTAVWTGTRVVVWGGTESETGGPFLNTGGRYDPLADAWTPTATLNAPSARANHTAVWTGYSMIVWGGYGGTYVGGGGRYDPVSDTWTPTSASNAPPARAYHTAVWTGNRMVVWGGYDGTHVGTGGRYDPWSDTWTPTSASNAPPARAVHTAVWTGSKMVVWGGASDGGFGTYFDTGGLYDPASDTWTPTSTSNAPQARAVHTAVWTGGRMVVWGGFWSGEEFWSTFETGGRYDPVADAWTSTSTLSGPSSRSGHTAVWTGRSMIVWGGERIDLSLSGPYFNQGGRYFLGDSIDGDGDGFAGCDGDCNDHDATVFPGAAESCDGLDRDCDGVVAGADQDGDGSCAQVDCNDLDPSVQGVAMEVQGVTIEKAQPTIIHFASQDALSGSSTSYDMASGSLADLRATAGFEQAWCVGSFADTPAEDAGPDPGVGQGYYYLVRAKNECGSGGWGPVSAGSSRIVTACP